MLTTRMTRKGQITIPAEIRDRLHLDEGDVFLVREENGKVVLESQLVELRRAAEEISALVKHIPPMEPDEMRAVAEAAIAEEGAETLRQIERDWLANQAPTSRQ